MVIKVCVALTKTIYENILKNSATTEAFITSIYKCSPKKAEKTNSNISRLKQLLLVYISSTILKIIISKVCF